MRRAWVSSRDRRHSVRQWPPSQASTGSRGPIPYSLACSAGVQNQARATPAATLRSDFQRAEHEQPTQLPGRPLAIRTPISRVESRHELRHDAVETDELSSTAPAANADNKQRADRRGAAESATSPLAAGCRQRQIAIGLGEDAKQIGRQRDRVPARAHDKRQIGARQL